MTAAKFLLEHFYHGQVVQQGKPAGEPRLLAASSGVTPELAALAVERVRLPPLIRSQKGSWAVVRGRDRQIPFLVIQSQQAGAGQVMAHYIIAPADVIRAIGGNLRPLLALVQAELPAYEKPGAVLPQIEVAQPEPLTVEEQIDDILDLMTFTKNRLNVIEALLGAIVQGIQVYVQGAPPNLEERVAFVEGLLALLPASARFGVTFTTHSLPSTELNTQIRFYSDDLAPDGVVVYNWASGQVTGTEIQDDYSRFVMSQLRLDAELVIQKTGALTKPAGWRINQGDKLAEALGYASKRLRIDEALRTNQPVNKDEVAQILEQDPTLDDELRVLYAQHLIRFSLAMQDMSHADPVAILLRANPDLERAVLRQMEDALSEGLGWLLYDTLVNWMVNPLGPQGRAWIDLTHRAALMLLDNILADGDSAELSDFVRQITATGPGIAMERIAPQIIQKVLPASAKDVSVAETVFLLAVKFLNTQDFLRVLASPAFQNVLSMAARRLLAHINGEQHDTPSTGLIMQTAREFGQQWNAEVLMRFAELAVMRGRGDLIDTPALEGLVQIASSPEGPTYASRLLPLTAGADDATLMRLQPPGPYYLLQLRLILGDYADVARLIIRQLALLYGDRQIEYLKMLEKLFSETPLPEADIPRALDAINQAGIKSAPFVVASIGALERQAGSPELDAIAQRARDAMFDESRLLDVIPPKTVMALLAYHVRRKDVENAILAASVVPLSASFHGIGGVKMMAQMYKRMEWEPRTKVAALQMLRVFVREIEDGEQSSNVVDFFGRELGEEVRRALETTLLVRQLMGTIDILEYARWAHITAEFLQDTVATYADSKNVPTPGDLLERLNAMRGGLTPAERRQVARNILRLARATAVLGKQYRTNRPRDEARHIAGILKGDTDALSALDVLRAMGGYFARARRFETQLKPDDAEFPGYRSVEQVAAEIETAAGVLDNAMRALPPTRPVKLPIADLAAEVESLWSEATLEQQREVVRNLVVDLQRIADLVAFIESSGDARIFEESSLSKKLETGRYRPKNTLEFYRFLYWYYLERS